MFSLGFPSGISSFVSPAVLDVSGAFLPAPSSTVQLGWSLVFVTEKNLPKRTSAPLEQGPPGHQHVAPAFCPGIWPLIMESELKLSPGGYTSFESKTTHNLVVNYCLICLC